MPVKIRLMRIGATKRPFYRVVAVDERKKRTGAYLELLGTYNPLTTPKEINLKQDLIDAWLKKGAQPSDGFLRIIGKAPQRQPRKPKKAPKEAPAAPAEQPAKPEEADTEPVENADAVTKAPVEEVAAAPEAVVEEAPTEEVAETPAEETVDAAPEEEAK